MGTRADDILAARLAAADRYFSTSGWDDVPEAVRRHVRQGFLAGYREANLDRLDADLKARL